MSFLLFISYFFAVYFRVFLRKIIILHFVILCKPAHDDYDKNKKKCEIILKSKFTNLARQDND